MLRKYLQNPQRSVRQTQKTSPFPHFFPSYSAVQPPGKPIRGQHDNASE